jgi:putative peptidoglycan lipid II flippase
MGGTLASRASGLLREVLLIALFPVRASDAFRLAWTVPNLFRELLAEGALTNAFIPIYQRLRGDDRRAFAGAMLSVLALANAVLLALALLGAPWIVDLLLARDANVDRELAVQLVRLTFPVLFAISLSALAMGVLNAEERFFAPAWAPVLLNLVAIAAMLAFPGEARGWRSASCSAASPRRSCSGPRCGAPGCCRCSAASGTRRCRWRWR